MTGNLLQGVAVLRVSDFAAAQSYYEGSLGFEKDWLFQLTDAADPAYASFSRGGASLHVSSFSGDGVFGSVALLYVGDVDALYEEFVTKGVPVEMEPADQTWGTRDMYVRDPDGNSLRFCQSARAAALDRNPGV